MEKAPGPPPPDYKNMATFIIAVCHAVWPLFSVFQVISIKRINCWGFQVFLSNPVDFATEKKKKEDKKYKSLDDNLN